MAYSFLVFDFGGKEDVAQQARHRIEGWKQGFRLDKKLQLKFDRAESPEESEAASSAAPKEAKTSSKTKSGGSSKLKSKSKSGDEEGRATATTAPASDIRMIVRLDFSDHEKLSHQRWLERIPGEEPFRDAKPRIVRPGDPEFAAVSDQFDSLD